MADSSSSSSTLAAATAAALPVGFRFRPTDEELVRHYLKAKIAGRAHPDLLAIPDVDLAAVEPWDLPARSVIKSDDPEWFFFAHRDRPKYPGKSSRSCRSTAAGYWKATGKDRLIRAPGPGGRGKGALIGVKKTLVFHRGRAPRGARTPWIMHEYTATEPHLQSGQDGSFVLYRLFNKQDEETPAPKTESPSMSSPGNSQPQADNIASASMVVDKASPVDSSQLTPTNVTTNHSSAAHLLATANDIVSASMVVDKASPSDSSQLTPTNVTTVHSSEAHLLPTASDTHQTEAENAALWNMFAEFPDLQAEQTYAKFPTISSPMHPHTDFRFIGNMGDEQDFSPYLKNFLGEQDVQNVLFNPPYDEPGTGNAVSNPTAATPLCSTGSGSWALYPQEMFDSLLEQGSSDMINSNGQGDWAASSSTQQPTAPGFFDLQQGTAARRIRLAYPVERASASQPILASHSESGAEAESCYSTRCSSSYNEEDHGNAVSPTMAGDLMHIQGRGQNIPPQALVSPVEVAEKLQHLSFSDNMSEQHANPPRGAAGLKQRIKQDSVQNARGGLLQNSGRVPGKSSKEAAKRSTRSLWLALLVMVVPLLVLVGVLRSLSYQTV